ncbi:Armadillo-like helical domain-containing protein 3 [Nymphon striatum]|nr:Armadillo-like helical domain-containing protein 3 [Nymphon striatum]
MMLKTKFFITQSQVEDVEDFSELGGHLELAKLAAKDPETSDFVLAKLTPINSSKEVHYVGQITEVSTDEGETSYEVEFYRQSRKVCGRFIKPDVEDNCKIMGKTAAKKAFKEKIILSYDKFFKNSVVVFSAIEIRQISLFMLYIMSKQVLDRTYKHLHSGIYLNYCNYRTYDTRTYLGENPSVGNPDFWNELFLLKANVSYIENEFDKLSGDQVLAIKENINLIFYHCVKALEDDRQIRVVNAIQTLCALVRGVYKKTNKDYGFDIINVLVGFDSAENVMQCLIGNLNRFLTQDTPVSLKSLCLTFILIFVTSTDNVSQNTMLEYIMMNSLFETIVKLLVDSQSRIHHGSNAVLLLTILVNYRKYESKGAQKMTFGISLAVGATGSQTDSPDNRFRSYHSRFSVWVYSLSLCITKNLQGINSANPYIVNLSILDNELALNVSVSLFCVRETGTNDRFELDLNLCQSDAQVESCCIYLATRFLLFGYGQVVSAALADFNRKYCSLRTEPTNSGFFSTITNMVGNMFVSDESGNIPKVNMRINDAILLALYEAIHLNRNFITTLTHSQTSASCPPSPVLASTLTGDGTQTQLNDLINCEPSNLLVTFLEYCSIVMQDSKGYIFMLLKSENHCFHNLIKNNHLAFIILTCIAEDQYANSLMHDVNMVFRVKLHKMPMRHRKTAVTTVSSAEPLACAVLNLMVEFVISHMKKNFPIDLFVRCLGVIHRILCYQKRCRVRLNYEWKELWSSLINLLKFLLAHETHLVKKCNIFQVSDQIINILNLFITFGDTFLPKPTIYDALYYEISIHIVFDNLYSMALRYSTNDGEYKGTASKLTNSLVNIRAIINHFSPKIDKWSTENQQATLTESQVLEVVQSNYDTLTLKLHDNLDQYERYSEKPKEVQFFTQLIRSVVSDFRKNLCFTSLEQQSVLQEFSSIS